MALKHQVLDLNKSTYKSRTSNIIPKPPEWLKGFKLWTKKIKYEHQLEQIYNREKNLNRLKRELKQDHEQDLQDQELISSK